MELALAMERYPLWKRNCPEMSDIDFFHFGILRCISTVDSGRHFLQVTEQIYGEPVALSTYFKSLKSLRRTQMLAALEKQSYSINCKTLASNGIDYLQQFSELDQYTVEAADGHFIDHAYHTEKGANGKAYTAGFIYSLDLRYGLLKPLCCITNGTNRNHEIPILRNHIEKQNEDNKQSQKQLYVYDKAVTDYAWWNKQKSHENYMISVLKENSVANFVESISFDKNSPINTGIESYSIYENNGIKFSIVNYRDPETQKLHRFITTLPTSINPGTIAMVYYKRWTIEKAFNNSKSDLKEKKAWSSDSNALNNQMSLTAITYNIMRVFEEVSKVEN
ncbi:MAG TPA: transposase, partial [Candidatus Scalindua sp.]|nr:transposase [Candidatus Scalindua sp.]